LVDLNALFSVTVVRSVVATLQIRGSSNGIRATFLISRVIALAV